MPQPPPTPPPTPPVPAAEAEAFTDAAKQGEAERGFAYSWPQKASAIPALAAMLRDQRDEALAQQKSEWAEALAEFGADGCISCVNRDYSMEWQVVTDTPRFLSLSSTGYVYTGGAHGMPLFDSVVWDREAEDAGGAGGGGALHPVALFSSPGALDAALRKPFCAALDKERAKRREGFDMGEIFNDCPALDELVILLGSSNGMAINRIGLIAPPYVAGPYAEGAYEVTLPVTRAVLAAVDPRYRSGFAVR